MKIPLRFPPGIQGNGTKYQSKARWRDAHLVRFADGIISPVGGWAAVPIDAGGPETQIAAGEVVRALLAWTLEGEASPYLALGSQGKVYTFSAAQLTDRTPVGLVAGQVDTEMATGAYGLGDYGEGDYGEGSSTQTTLVEASLWEFDTFGNYLLGVLSPSDGKLWLWDGASAAMEEADPDAPTGNAGVVVTPERFVVLLGADGNPRRVQWPSQETVGGLNGEGISNWTPDSSNTAGGYTLPGSGKILCGRRGRNETFIFTEEDVFSMQYIGGELVYRLDQLGSKCGAIAKKAVAVADRQAIWMGRRSFFVYDGYVQPVPSEVNDLVFSDFNRVQAAKCWAETRAEFGEVWFHYPSAGSNECDKYVIYNYREKHWTSGVLHRAAGVDRGIFQYPLAIYVDGALDSTLYEHEKGNDRDGEDAPYLESGPVELGDGDVTMDIDALIPDEATASGQSLGSAEVTIYLADYPNEAESANGPYVLAAKTDLRLTGRLARVRYEEVEPGAWKIGVIRLDVRPGSER